MSVWNFLRAPFAVALVVGLASTAVFNPFAVHLKQRAENIEAELRGSGGRGDRGYWFRQDGAAGPSIMHAGSVSEDGRLLFGVTAFAFDKEGAFDAKVTAGRAEFEAGRWVFSNAEVISASSAPSRAARSELPTELGADELTRIVRQPETRRSGRSPALSIRRSTRASIPIAFGSPSTRLSTVLSSLAMVMIAGTVSLRLARYGGTWRLVLTGCGRLSALCFSRNRRDLGERDHRSGAGGMAAADRRADFRRDGPALSGGRVKHGCCVIRCEALRPALAEGGRSLLPCAVRCRLAAPLPLGARAVARPCPARRRAAAAEQDSCCSKPTSSIYDFDRETVTATGNVQIYYGGYVLDAETRHLRPEVRPPDRHRRRAHAGAERQHLSRPKRLDITDDFRDGFVEQPECGHDRQARFSAQTAERRDGNLTDLPQGRLHGLRAVPRTSGATAALADQGGAHHPRPAPSARSTTRMRGSSFSAYRSPMCRSSSIPIRRSGARPASYAVGAAERRDRLRRDDAVLLESRAELRRHLLADLLTPPGAPHAGTNGGTGC